MIETFGFALKYLNLANCNILVEDLAKLTSALTQCENLEFLDISWN